MSLPASQTSEAWRSIRLAAITMPIRRTATTTITTAAIASVIHQSVTTSVGIKLPLDVFRRSSAASQLVVASVDETIDKRRLARRAPAAAHRVCFVPTHLAIVVALRDSPQRADEGTD